MYTCVDEVHVHVHAQVHVCAHVHAQIMADRRLSSTVDNDQTYEGQFPVTHNKPLLNFPKNTKICSLFG